MCLSFLRKSRPSKLFSPKASILAVSAIALALTGNAMTGSPASAAFAGMGSAALQYQLKEVSPLIEVRRGGGGGGRHMGGGGGRHMGGGGGRHVAGGVGRPGVGRPGVGRPGVGRPGVGRPGVVAGGRGRWVRPARYTWRPGGAIAAGAALGFVTAATAAAWAGAPPVAGYCWYYTDFTQTQGFWDVCP
jgi:hypothetical protein